MGEKIFNLLFKKQKSNFNVIKRKEDSFISNLIEKRPQNADELWGLRGEFYRAVFLEHRESIL